MNKLQACLKYIRLLKFVFIWIIWIDNISEKYKFVINCQSFGYLKISNLKFVSVLLLFQYVNFLWLVNGFSKTPNVLWCIRTFDCCFFRCQILWKKNILNPQTYNTNPILCITKDFLLMKNTFCSARIIYILCFFLKRIKLMNA